MDMLDNVCDFSIPNHDTISDQFLILITDLIPVFIPNATRNPDPNPTLKQDGMFKK